MQASESITMNKAVPDNLRCKDSKKPEYRQLYERLPFIEAYAEHTNMRIAKDGPELAIGAKQDGQQDWDIHGKAQLDFLIARGLKPESKLLDFGCGTGRLAAKAVPYLNKGHYMGVDISETAIAHCADTIPVENWMQFIHSPSGHIPQPGFWNFDFVFSHSVVTHLPPEFVELIFTDLALMQFGVYYFTFKASQTNQRSGLKQFQYADSWLIETAKKYGLHCERDPKEWPAGQKTMAVRRA